MNQCTICHMKKPLVKCEPCGHADQCKKCLNKLLHNSGNEGQCPTCKNPVTRPLNKKQKKAKLVKMMTERQLTFVQDQLNKGVQIIELDELSMPEVDALLESYGYYYEEINNRSIWKFDVSALGSISSSSGSGCETDVPKIDIWTAILWIIGFFVFGVIFGTIKK